MTRPIRILLGMTGSVATTLGRKIIGAFDGDEVIVVQTPAAARFCEPVMRDGVLNVAGAKVLTEDDEWAWRKVGDQILHVELRDWMDVLVIAPLSANSLGKMANGICDNLLISIWLASGKKPTVVAPAMNTQMWLHPAVVKNALAIREMGVRVVDPVEKVLACGETGVGAMAEIGHIAAVARHSAEESRRMLCAP